MSEEKEFDTSRTDFVTCPHCGYEDPDGWEYFLQKEVFNGSCICGKCKRGFEAWQEVDVCYTTAKIKDGK